MRDAWEVIRVGDARIPGSILPQTVDWWFKNYPLLFYVRAERWVVPLEVDYSQWLADETYRSGRSKVILIMPKHWADGRRINYLSPGSSLGWTGGKPTDVIILFPHSLPYRWFLTGVLVHEFAHILCDGAGESAGHCSSPPWHCTLSSWGSPGWEPFYKFNGLCQRHKNLLRKEIET